MKKKATCFYIKKCGRVWKELIMIMMIIIIIIIKNNLNLLLIRKLTTKSGLFTIKFCLKKTIQYKYYLQFISIKKTHIIPIKKFISIKTVIRILILILILINTNTNTNF